MTSRPLSIPTESMLSEPARYDVDELLRDGSAIRIRAIRPEDQGRLKEHANALSRQSAYFRFLGARSRLSEAELERFTVVDFREHVALIATRSDDRGEKIIGVGRFIGAPDRPKHKRSGEVAFAVLDAYHGRGIGTLLLEHLAAIARRLGYAELDADVLVGNEAMLQVFAESGLEMRTRLEGGVVQVTLSTEPSAPFSRKHIEREMAASAASLKGVLEPNAVALIGASRRVGTIGHAILENLKKSFLGPVYPVHPSASEIDGLRAHPTVLAICAPVDLAVIAVPGAAVEEVVQDCARAGVKAVVVISAGFAETGPPGREAERRILDRIRGAGMRLVGPNCMGVLTTDPGHPMNATFAPSTPPVGNIGMLSQSGALGLAMLDMSSKLNLGLSSFVSVGNKADVSSNDLLSYWEADPRTKVVVLYLESLGNPGKFARVAPIVAHNKPIVAVKSGRSLAGTRAAASHSAALASLDVAVDALFQQAGVIRTATFEDLFDLVALLSTQPLPKGKRVGVVTNSGGPGILLADACEAQQLSLPTLGDATLERLRSFLPKEASLKNPVDMIAAATPEQYRRAIEVVGTDPAIDALVAIYTPPFVTDPDQIALAIAAGAGAIPADTPILTVFMSSKGAPAVLAQGPRGAIPSYSFPENAAMALGSATRHSEWRSRERGEVLELSEEQRGAVRRIVRRALSGAAEGSVWLELAWTQALLQAVGIRFAAFEQVEPADATTAARSLGFPVVLKAVAPGLLHKSELGAVIVGQKSEADVARSVELLAARLEAAGHRSFQVMVQEQVDPGVEALVGVTKDPSLGPVILAGMGGVQAELSHDISFRLPPVSDRDAREMIERLRAKRLFDGYRGSLPVDKLALIDVIRRVSALVESAPEIVEMDLNPVMVLPQGACVVDARIRLAPL
jgi:acetyl coenzyme A synthetase (ADP forming)-like protein